MKAFQRADRTQHDRQAQLVAEHFRRGIDLADVAQHARPERDRVERHAVAPQRRLGLGAADDIVPIVLVEIGAGLGDDFVQVHELRRVRHLARRAGFVDDRDWLVHWGTRCGLRDGVTPGQGTLQGGIGQFKNGPVHELRNRRTFNGFLVNSGSRVQRRLAVPGRLELPTFGLGNRCSILLSYGTRLILRVFFKEARKGHPVFAPTSGALTATLIEA